MAFLKIAGGVALAALVSGCTINPYHVPPNLVIDPTTSPRDKMKKDSEDRSGRGKVQAGAAGAGPVAGAKTSGDVAAGYSIATPPFVEKFYDAYRRSYDDPDVQSPAYDLTRYGMTMIDTRCDLFFEQIGRGSQKGDFIRRQFQSISAALVAALGLTNVGQDAVTGLGIGSALGLQSIDNYSTVYFFSPDVGAVQQLVHKAFASLRTSQLTVDKSPKSFEEALSALRTYQNVCTTHSIKRLVTEAVNTSNTEARPLGAVVAQQDGEIERTLSKTAELFSIKSLSLSDAALIEMLVLNDLPEKQNESDVDYICESLAPEVSRTLCDPVTRVVGNVAVQGYAAKLLEPSWLGKLRARLAALVVVAGDPYSAALSGQAEVVRSNGVKSLELRVREAVRDERIKELERERQKIEAGLLAGQKSTALDEKVGELKLEQNAKAADARLLKRVLAAPRTVADQTTTSSQPIGVSVVGAATPPPSR